MKRGVYFLLAILVAFPLVPSLASAQSFGYGGGIDIPGILERLKYNAGQLFTPLFQTLLGDYSQGQTLFVKILFSLLIFFVVYGTLKKVKVFENSKNITLVVSLVVSLLAARGVVADGLIQGLLVPYSALGVSISVFFPMVIYFFFVQRAGDSSFVRRGAWALYGIVFLVLYWSRIFYPGGDYAGTAEISFIYGIGFLALVAFIIFDSSLHYYFKLWGLRKFITGVNTKTVAALQAEYMTIVNVDTSEARARRREIEYELRHIHHSNVP